MIRKRSIRPSAILCILLLVALAPLALADSPRRGFVDGSRFLDFAEEEGTEIEVSVAGAILRALSGVIAGEDKDAAEAVARLESVDALVVELAPGKVSAARKLMRSIESRLRGEGWDRLARLRDDDSHVTVLMLEEGDVVFGLVVMVFEPSSRQMVFTNIVGNVDLATLSRLNESFDLPGLDQIPGHE